MIKLGLASVVEERDPLGIPCPARNHIGNDIFPPVTQHSHQTLQICEILLHLLDGNQIEVIDDFCDVLNGFIEPTPKHRIAAEFTNVPTCKEQSLFDGTWRNLFAQSPAQGQKARGNPLLSV